MPRVVFASSIHAVGFHPATDTVPDDARPRLDTYRRRDDAERFADEVGHLVDPATDTLVGGAFTGPSFDGGARRG